MRNGLADDCGPTIRYYGARAGPISGARTGLAMPKKLDRNKAIPREGLNQVRHKGAQRMVFDKPEPDEMFELACNEHDGPIKGRLEQDRPYDRRTIIAPPPS
jgi:hypothetical protein